MEIEWCNQLETIQKLNAKPWEVVCFGSDHIWKGKNSLNVDEKVMLSWKS
jgi:hypothetical protein